METVNVITDKQKKEYIDFIYKIYEKDSIYRDLNLIIVKNFLWQKDKHSKRCTVQPMFIKDDNSNINAAGTFIHSDDTKELKLSFLEFLPDNQKYLNELIRQGRIIAHSCGLNKIVIGINGHISYGLGILTGENNGFEFNANYNPGYYTEELDKLGLKKKKVFSYKYPTVMSIFTENIQGVLDKVYNTYTFRTMNMRDFKNEMLLFGELCDKAMAGTPYYSTKTKEEMYELMKQMKLLLKNDDVIFALKDGVETGFVFTHPDYAEFMEKKKVNPISVFIKNRFKKADKAIYNIIGVLPEHRYRGLTIGLIHKAACNLYEAGYKEIVSSFVLEENTQSTEVCKIFSQGIAREYNLYELDL